MPKVTFISKEEFSQQVADGGTRDNNKALIQQVSDGGAPVKLECEDEDAARIKVSSLMFARRKMNAQIVIVRRENEIYVGQGKFTPRTIKRRKSKKDTTTGDE